MRRSDCRIRVVVVFFGVTAGDRLRFAHRVGTSARIKWRGPHRKSGAALLSTLEKRDAQQVEHLHVTQQQNILNVTTQTRQPGIDAAQNALDSLNKARDRRRASDLPQGHAGWRIE
jgi:hypothetical protein